jgi:hypothetical protein
LNAFSTSFRPLIVFLHSFFSPLLLFQDEDPWALPSSDEISFRSVHTVPVLLTWQGIHCSLEAPTPLFSCCRSAPPEEPKEVLHVRYGERERESSERKSACERGRVREKEREKKKGRK